MKKTMFGRALAAMLLLGTATAAEAGGYYGGSPASATTGFMPPAWQSGGVQTLDGGNSTLALSATFASSTIFRCWPALADGSGTATSLGVLVNSPAAAGNFAMAIYNDAPSGAHRPYGATPLVQSGTVAVASGSTVLKEVTGLSYPMAVGTLYWECLMTDNTAYAFFGTNAGSLYPARFVGKDINGATGGQWTGYQYTTSAFGTWPDMTNSPPASTDVTTATPKLRFRLQ